MRKLLFLALLAQAGCGGSSQQESTPSPDTAAPPVTPSTSRMDSASRQSDVILTTDARSYRPGDPVELRIANHSATRFTYNPCTRLLERQDEESTDKWTPVMEDRMCTMVAHVVEPNASRVEKTELGEQLPPGSYRMIVQFIADVPASKARKLNLYTYFKVTSTR